jgi:hypothetical protein
MRMSLPTAIAHAISDAETDFPAVTIQENELGEEVEIMGEPESINIGQLCPNCQEFSVVHMNGCQECAYGCGYTAC